MQQLLFVGLDTDQFFYVKVTFYEKAFHGLVNHIHSITGFKLDVQIQNDLIDFLKENL